MIVKPNVPVAAAAVVETVSVELCPAGTDVGLKLAVAPAGNPVAERLTGRDVPVRTPVLTVYVVVEPWTTVWFVGLALMVKSLRAKLPGPPDCPARCAASALARAKMAWSSTRYGNPAGGPALDTGIGWEPSMRDPTLLIGPRALVWLEGEGLAALAGCEASVRQRTTTAVKAHLITRIDAPLPAGPGLALGCYRLLDRRAPAGVITRTRALSRAD